MDNVNCSECGYFKTYINRKEMARQGTDETIFLHVCENINRPPVVTDSSVAKDCEYYDDDSWMK
ncbi:hypothetical protein BCP8-2_191 [Bacillus phage BCP8-2]|uniref:TFIIS-type domain-containing protein n=1 Tax=Bacillus phage BCP8-2 TaxID=1129192 RepID=A0A0E3D9K0_9CAUD|nr:hypothetical protein BCP8-2_191 [Bacillus phage BCP8-2]AHJ87229.1 hypothetical protein BCP8-2_191 [Bacillus phage BCP8-2]